MYYLVVVLKPRIAFQTSIWPQGQYITLSQSPSPVAQAIRGHQRTRTRLYIWDELCTTICLLFDGFQLLLVILLLQIFLTFDLDADSPF